jgi:hypothetical protein
MLIDEWVEINSSSFSGSQNVFPTTPWLSGYSPVMSVKWLGKVTLGKLGVMYCGETPLATRELSAGVRPRSRKSARKPSSEITIVVGAKSAVPFQSRGIGWAREARKPLEALYAPRTRMKKSMTMRAPMNENFFHEGRGG